MAEKRKSKRHARRLKVTFGPKGTPGFPYGGLTNDVSSTGLFIVSGQNLKPGTRVHVDITLPGEAPLYIEGVVTRASLVPTELRQIMKSGFGMRYLTGTELMAELVPALAAHKKVDPFCLVFTDEAVWRQSLEQEFRRGGAFVWLPKSVPADSTVTVTFDLRFLDRQLAFAAKVMHSTENPDGRFGVALMFVDPTSTVAALNGTLGERY